MIELEGTPCDHQCRRCPSSKHAPVLRTLPADVAIVVDFPTDVETKRGLLNSDRGELAIRLLRAYGVDPEDAYITTALNCRPDTSKDAMMKNAMLACRERLVTELRSAGAKKVLCLGPVGYSALSSAERVLPITKVRGRWTEHYGMQVLATFNPTMVLGVHEFFRDLEADVKKFCTSNGREPDPDVTLWLPDSVGEMREAFEFLSDASYVTLDVETTGLSPIKDDLLAVGLGVLHDDARTGTCVILDRGLLQRRLTWALLADQLEAGQRSVFHNAKFDLKWLIHELRGRGVEAELNAIEDTMLLNYCIDERASSHMAKPHGLKQISALRCDAPDYDIEMGKWLKQWKAAEEAGDVLTLRTMEGQMHTYLALDCYYTARVFEVLPDEIESVEQRTVYDDILIPGTLALAEIELHGIKVDRAFYKRTQKELATRAAPILERLQAATGDEQFNPNSPPQVKRLVYTELGMPFGIKQQAYLDKHPDATPGEVSKKVPVKDAKHTARRGKQQEGPTSKAVLKQLAKKYPHKDPDNLIAEILAYRNLTKTAGTYVTGMLARMDDDDRVRGDFLQHGTSTGRLSSSNPNLQNIPEASHTKIEIRNGFVAPEGMILIEADYSQLELRMAAHMSNDDNFCAVYIEDRDVHQEVAFAFFNKPADQISKYERYMAKCVNFGVVYGRGAASIALGPEMEYVEEIGGDRWTVGQVKGFFDAFFNNFPDFKQWCEDQATHAYEHHYCESPLGRRRRFPFIPRQDGGAVGRQAVNSPIQGTASDFTFTALVRIHVRLKEMNKKAGKIVAHIVSTVHDSILIECVDEYVGRVLAIVKEEMEDNCPIKSRVPFKADADVAPAWGMMGKYEWDSDRSVLELVASSD